MQYIPRLKTAYKQPHPPQSFFNKGSRSLFANLDQTRLTGLMPPFLPPTLKRIGLLDIKFAGAQGSFTSGLLALGKNRDCAFDSIQFYLKYDESNTKCKSTVESIELLC